MTTVLRRGQTFHYSETFSGRRCRFALGTSDRKSAQRLAGRINLAIAEGPESDKWSALRLVLPTASYRTLATGMEVKIAPDLAEFEILFKHQLDRREKLGEIAASTHGLYERAAETFFTWLAGQGVFTLKEIAPTLVEEYQVWRKEVLSSKPQSKNGVGLRTDNTVLAAIFELAMGERLLDKSPFKGRFRCYGDPRGAEPFTQTEMTKLEAACQEVDEELLFRIFKWTGLRGSDVADMTWGAFDLESGTLRWKTRKRGVWVTIPVAHDLLCALKLRPPSWRNDKVFPGATRTKLYSIIRKLGDRAGVPNANPHRFRDTLAVDILAKGGTIYDVAKILGDHVSTVEKHYAPFTERLQERVRKILDSEAARELRT